MGAMSAEHKIVTAVSEQAADHGVSLVEAHVKGSAQHPIVELRFDSLVHPYAISAEELDKTTVWVSRLMDELDPFESSYTLEVSSPGLMRKLSTDADFLHFLGECIQVKLQSDGHVGTRLKYTGVLKECDAEKITVEVDGTLVELAKDEMEEARLKPSTDALFSRKDR